MLAFVPLLQPMSSAMSFLYLDQEIRSEAQSLISFLERNYCQVPPELRVCAVEHLRTVERDQAQELCYQLKAFAKCRSGPAFKSRDLHVVSEL